MAVVVLAKPAFFNSTQLVPLHLLASFLFVAWPHPVRGYALPLYFPGWTLNYEAFLYIVLALFLGLILGKRVACAGALLLALAALGFLCPFDNEIYKDSTPSRP